jgi:hypothetical protein
MTINDVPCLIFSSYAGAPRLIGANIALTGDLQRMRCPAALLRIFAAGAILAKSGAAGQTHCRVLRGLAEQILYPGPATRGDFDTNDSQRLSNANLSTRGLLHACSA